MRTGTLEAKAVVPSPETVAHMVRTFGKEPDGIVTAFADGALKRLNDAIGDDVWAEALAFPALVRRMAIHAGVESRPVPNGRLRAAAVADAMRSLPPEHPFGPAAPFPGAHAAVARTIEELHGWGYGPEVLREATGPHADRIVGLAEVDEAARARLHALGFGSETDTIRRCLVETPDFDALPPRILVLAGDRRHPVRSHFLRWLADHGARVTVLLYQHPTQPGFFPERAGLEADLEAEATEAGPGHELARRLFGPFGAAPASLSITVDLFSAPSPLAEVEEVLRHALQAGPLEDQAVYVRGGEGTRALLESAARRLDVPLSLCRRDPLLSNRFACLTLDLTEALFGNDVRGLYRAVRRHLAEPDAGERLYARFLEARKDRERPWETLAAGLASEPGLDAEGLVALLEWRLRATEPAPVSTWVERFRELLELLPWREIEGRSSRDAVRRNSAAQVVMEQTLVAAASVAQLGHDPAVTGEEFVRLCRRDWGREDVNVQIGDEGQPALSVVTDVEALPAVSRLHVVGLAEGTFPRRVRQDPVLDDEARAALSALGDARGLPPVPDTRLAAARERTDFYRLAVSPSAALGASHPRADADRDLGPAVFLDRLVEASGQAVRAVPSAWELAPPDSSLEADVRLRAALDAPPRPHAPVALDSELAQEALRREADRPVTLEGVTVASRCGFRFVAADRLGLRRRQGPARWHRLRGVPAAASLPVQPDERLEEALEAALQEELDRWYPSLEPWEATLLEESASEHVRGWADRERVARQYWPRHDAQANQGFEDLNALLQVKIPGLQIEGTVAGISRMGRYLLVSVYGGRKVQTRYDRDQEREEMLRQLDEWSILMLAFYKKGRPVAIETDAMHGGRVIVVPGRWTADDGKRRVGQSHEVLSLDTVVRDLPPLRDGSPDLHQDTVERMLHMYAVKRILREARRRIAETDVTPRLGSWCASCPYGDLCREAERHEADPFGGEG